MASSFFGLVRLMISGGDGEEDPHKEAVSRSKPRDEKKKVISRWEFVEDESTTAAAGTADCSSHSSSVMTEAMTPEPLSPSSEPEHIATPPQGPSPAAGVLLRTEDEQQQRDDNKKKLNKKKKSKRKRRANSVNSMEESKKGVRWGGVEVVNFSRDLVRVALLFSPHSPPLPLCSFPPLVLCQGFHNVPYSGNFPLGLGEEVSRCVSTIDEHLAATQIRLLERATEIGLDVSAITEPYADADAEDTPSEVDEDAINPRISLETRQFDYRHGYNPLFRPLSEADRFLLLFASHYLTLMKDCCPWEPFPSSCR